MNMKNKESKVWILYTFIFVLVTVLLFRIIMENPFWGSVCVLFLFLIIIVGGILESFFNRDNVDEGTIELLGIKELKGSQRLLRYATAILAFLSLLTTANGMKSFVFSESWMAYLASFAVQSILVVFSLLLCRFFVQVADLKWELYIKRIVNGIMIAFFCIALLISSVFSFTFIANNAYKNTWASDSETIIQEFLLQEIDSLKIENETRGKIIIKSINEGLRDKIKGIVEKARKNNINNWQKDLIDLEGKFPSKSLKKGKVNINKRELLETYPQYENDINYLCKHYKKYSNCYDNAIDSYNTIIKEVKKWNENTNSEDIYNKSEKWLGQIDSENINLDNSKKNIMKLKTYKLNQDFSTVRSDYIQEVDDLKSKFIDIRGELEKIKDYSSKIMGNLK